MSARHVNISDDVDKIRNLTKFDIIENTDKIENMDKIKNWTFKNRTK